MHASEARVQQRALLEWASRVFRDEGPQLVPRIATVRGGEVQHFVIDRSFELRGLVQAASVLARSVDDEDLVVALSPGRSSRALEATEWGSVADIRSRAGHRTLRMLGARPRAGRIQHWQRKLPAGSDAGAGGAARATTGPGGKRLADHPVRSLSEPEDRVNGRLARRGRREAWLETWARGTQRSAPA